jgi:hypothetical protein
MIAALKARQKALRAEIKAGEARLAEIATALERDGLTVAGSRGQLRANPLLADERALRRDLDRARRQLVDAAKTMQAEERRLAQEATLARMNARMAWKRSAESA